jgi:translation initiation factor IF-2
MAKIRVSALAKELKVSSDALVQILRASGENVKSHSSSVDDGLKEVVKKKLDEQRAEIKKKYASKESRLSKRRGARPTRRSDADKPAEGATAENKPANKPAAGGNRDNRDNRGNDRRPQQNRDNRGGQQGGNGQGERRPYNRDNRGGQQGGNTQGGNGQGGRPQFNRDNRGGQQGGNGQGGNGQGGNGQGGRPQFNRDNRGGQQGGQGGNGQGGRPQFNRDNRGGQGGQGGNGQGGRPQFNRGGQQGGGQGGRPFNRDNRGGGQGGSAPIDPNSTYAKEMANKQAELKKAEEGGASKKKGAKKKANKNDRYKKKEVSEVEMKANIKKTLAKIGAGSTKKKYKKKEAEVVEATEGTKELLVSEFISVDEFTKMIGANVSEVIAKCLELGLFVTINQRLDFDTIELLAAEYDFEAKLMEEFAEDVEEEEEDDRPLVPRAPVVTVMGHVDHGKTSLLDYIRKENVTGGEAGGITQHIASYEVETKNGKVTFLDTPGHEAFAAMRARGSQVTDVVVLIVAADSAVMPQTKEAIDHTRAAGVPMVVAINKVDLPTANVDKIKADLAAYNVLVESFGGQIPSVELSAKTGQGIDELLEMLALETELLELQAPEIGEARGTVIESELDKGRGAIATVLIQKGTLKKGDAFVTGSHSGKVRELFNDRGQKIKEAGPSSPAMVLGLTGTPQAGDSFKVMDNEKAAREVAAKRRLAEKERELRHMNVVSLDNFFDTIKEGQVQALNIIVKGDVDGSVEALAASLEKLSTEEIKVNIIHKSVGGVKESDVMLAQASKGIIVGFHIHPNPKIREHAIQAGVDIRSYRIIYEAVDEVRDAMIGMLAPDVKEEILGQVEVREIFKVSKLGQIAGCMVTSGKILRDAKVRLIRDDVEIADTTFTSLQRFKDQAKEVAEGFDCGIMLKNVAEYQINDRIECYTEVEIERTDLKRKPKKDDKKEEVL